MTDTTKPVEPVAIVNDLMACDVGMITLPFSYGTVRKRIRQAITALDAANAEIERLKRELAAEKQYGEHHIALNIRLHQGALARAEKAEAESAALVAAAYQAAAKRCYEDQGRFDTPDRIRAMTPADATAALEAYGAAKVREGWKAGMKEAASVEAFMPGSGKMKPMMKPWQGAILTAIKEKQP